MCEDQDRENLNSEKKCVLPTVVKMCSGRYIESLERVKMHGGQDRGCPDRSKMCPGWDRESLSTGV